ncbi:coiled-coil domain-containing protein 149 isoform X1 [Leptidea sinapis]|uniref:coiled-coil domain-containing protein 149 isoform X1 n=1 Tax=Leptidea sinapis TaxID=189913 RepID=UPI002145B53A|nr:coiled-coil domain-containing protein 149 isoform X1 [Leptidea sinapis]
MQKISKVQFHDNHLIDDYILENSVLSSKLQSKVDALAIMSKELDKCSMERDRYKSLVEQMNNKNSINEENNMNCVYKYAPTNMISGGEILAKAKEHNNTLKLEVEKLKSKLEEANGDISALRIQLKKTVSDLPLKNNSSYMNNNIDYEQLVQDLERIQKKYRQIQMDYRATLDEKEELVLDRDYYKNKVQKLNHQIGFLLANKMNNSGDGDVKPMVDFNTLVTENKYLNERVTQLQVEKEILKRNFNKLKMLLENRAKNVPTKDKKSFGGVMTRKQVREYLSLNFKGLKKNSISELKSICLGLIDALHDKSVALQHQRKTNMILANRITDLEKTMESWCTGQSCVPIFPSQMLLDEILGDTSSVKSEDTKERNENEEKEINNDNYLDSDEEKPSSNDTNVGEDKNTTKVVLPEELQQLVTEALKEIKCI